MRYRPVSPCRLLAKRVTAGLPGARRTHCAVPEQAATGGCASGFRGPGGNMKRQLAGALLAVSAMVSLGALAVAPTAWASATSTQSGPAAPSTGGSARGTSAGGGPRTWHVLIGGHTGGQAIQGEGYYPHVITIDAGDTVVWTLNTKEIHAVAFAGTCEDISCVPPSCFTINIHISPCRPHNYNGVSAFDSSGRMVPRGYNWDNSVPHGGTAFSLTFTKPGANVYFDLSYAGMRGVVVVNAAGTPYPSHRRIILRKHESSWPPTSRPGPGPGAAPSRPPPIA